MKLGFLNLSSAIFEYSGDAWATRPAMLSDYSTAITRFSLSKRATFPPIESTFPSFRSACPNIDKCRAERKERRKAKYEQQEGDDE